MDSCNESGKEEEINVCPIETTEKIREIIQLLNLLIMSYSSYVKKIRR